MDGLLLAVNGRDVSNISVISHRQVAVVASKLSIKAVDCQDVRLWTTEISVKNQASLSETIPVMMFAAAGRLGAKVSEWYSVSNDGPVFKSFYNWKEESQSMKLYPESTSSRRGVRIAYILSSNGKTHVVLEDTKNILKFNSFDKYNIYLQNSEGRNYSIQRDFVFREGGGYDRCCFVFDGNFNLSDFPDLIVSKKGREVLSVRNIKN